MTTMDARQDGRDETADERADRNWDELMQELRVMQTGTQILTGFLLAVAFQPRFADLDAWQRGLYVVLVLLAAIATVLALTPVGMHRLLFAQRRKVELVAMAHRILKINLVVIAAVTAGVAVLILDVIGDRRLAAATGGILLLVIAALWLGMPLWLRRREADSDSGSAGSSGSDRSGASGS